MCSTTKLIRNARKWRLECKVEIGAAHTSFALSLHREIALWGELGKKYAGQASTTGVSGRLILLQVACSSAADRSLLLLDNKSRV